MIALGDGFAVAGLLLSAASTYLLSRSFVAIGSVDLYEIGAGALMGTEFDIFGVRWNLVKSACKQRADTLCGLVLLALGMLLQLAGLLSLRLLPPVHVGTPMTLTVAALFCALALGLATETSRTESWRFLKARTSELALSPGQDEWRMRVLSPGGREGLQQEMKNLLGDLASQTKIDRFTVGLYDRIKTRPADAQTA